MSGLLRPSAPPMPGRPCRRALWGSTPNLAVHCMALATRPHSTAQHGMAFGGHQSLDFLYNPFLQMYRSMDSSQVLLSLDASSSSKATLQQALFTLRLPSSRLQCPTVVLISPAAGAAALERAAGGSGHPESLQRAPPARQHRGLVHVAAVPCPEGCPGCTGLRQAVCEQ